jgi:hypothetical protein
MHTVLQCRFGSPQTHGDNRGTSVHRPECPRRREGSRFVMWNGSGCRFSRRRCSSLYLISRRLPEATQRMNLFRRGLGLIQRLVEAFPDRNESRREHVRGNSREPPADDQEARRYYTKTHSSALHRPKRLPSRHFLTLAAPSALETDLRQRTS